MQLLQLRGVVLSLVYILYVGNLNLVTQQDAATGTQIAHEAKADGISVKIIAALTMVFLPGTFLSSVFGMSCWTR